MSDIIEFTLKLNSYMGDEVKELGGITHNVFGGIDNDVEHTKRQFSELGEGVGEVHERMDMLQESAAMFFGSLAERGVERGLDFLKEQVTDVFKGGMEEGLVKMRMQVMTDPEGGTKLYEGIKGYIERSSFGDELNEAAVNMLSMNVAADKIVPTLKELGDVSMGDKEKLSRLAETFGEVSMTGHMAEGMIRRRLIGTGFSVEAELKTMGIAIKDHEITAKQFAAALDHVTAAGGRYHDMMEHMMETPGGKWQMMMTNIEHAKNELGVALLPVLGSFVDNLTPMIDELPAELERLRPSIEGLVNDFADLIKWVSNNTETIGNWFNVIKTGTEIFIGYKTVALLTGTAMNIYSKATAAAAFANRLLGISEIGATAATASQGYSVTVAAGEYEYYTTATMEATAATEALDTALTVTPWGMIAAGIGLVAGAYLTLKNNSDIPGGHEHDADIGDMGTPHSYQVQKNLDKQYDEWAKKIKADSTHFTIPGLGVVPDATWDKEPEEKNTKTKSGSKRVDEATSGITGGGRHVENINIRSFAEHFTVNNNGADMDTNGHKTEEWYREMWYRIIKSVPA
jgi:hypothetical protein